MRRLTVGALGALVCSVAACSGDDTADRATPATASTAVATSAASTTSRAVTTSSTSPTTTTAASSTSVDSTSTAPAETTVPPTTAPPSTAPVTTMVPPPDAAVLAEIPLAVQPFADVDMVTQMVVRPADNVAYASSQTGEIWRLADPAAPTLALDLSASVPPYEQGSERGLLGLGFGPADGRMYAFYSDLQNTSHVVSYAMNADGTADANSAWPVIDVPSAGFGHKGGAMSFDGPILYVALGDGGASKGRSAQDFTTLLGSIIRIVPHIDGPGYDVPPDNPFVADPNTRPELWAKGLREPWGFWRDPDTGTLWISDVGDHTMEEMNRMTADQRGLNFGWYFLEGTEVFAAGAPDGLTPPLFAYRHDEIGPASIGGRVYRGAAIPELHGAFVFGDMAGITFAVGAGDEITKLTLRGSGVVTGFAIGPDGELYMLTHAKGIMKVVPG
jgi:glucose/arabinose dehydrogenase